VSRIWQNLDSLLLTPGEEDSILQMENKKWGSSQLPLLLTTQGGHNTKSTVLDYGTSSESIQEDLSAWYRSLIDN
jgi:hypothetical protein